eukprot:TRINITY_DN4347_c0_g2_i1.p1 TRINITY_DN4347_c0_g2~~TRINITY_DN4347_c0_g2_i1.p1  ORF type:complete len:507 (+),score=117.44 TRINITY_DN4347_c0_g2_i1:51-1523(+)
MFCALSNQVPDVPVVSQKSGILFDKRLIEAYISENHKCPVKGHELEKEDLLALEAVHSARPRAAGQQSIPGLLQAQQAEWDAVMLENFQLKKQLDLVRQELSHALYKHDGACRVIARVMKERDAAHKALSELQGEVPAATAKAADGKAIPKEIFAKMTAAAKQLSMKRKKRALPSDLASKDDLKSMKEARTLAPHSTTTPGVTSVDSFNGCTVTGGMDGAVVVLNNKNEVQQKLTGHTKSIKCVFLSRVSERLVTASEEVVRVWAKGPRGYATVAEFHDHKKPVTSVCFNPTDDVLLTCGEDGLVNLYDMSSTGNGKKIVSLQEADIKKGFTCGAFHPDGMLMACATADGGVNSVRIWDLRSMKAFNLGDKDCKAVTTMSFSENGYALCTGSIDGVVTMWDLRRLEKLRSITFEDSDPARPTPVNKVAFDLSGAYLAICTDSLKIYDVATNSEVATHRDHKTTVTDCVWGDSARSITSCSIDRQVKTYEL